LDDGGRPPRESRPGDWDCPDCGATGNFKNKTECFKCQAPKPGKLFKCKIEKYFSKSRNELMLTLF